MPLPSIVDWQSLAPRARRLAATLLLACCAAAGAWAQTPEVSQAWVRGTVGGQQATGAFMQIRVATDATLIAASSPLAKSVEVHEMAMDAGVMKMRALDRLELPAGKLVEFKPGGYHLMLLGLSKPLKAGDSVPMELTLAGRDQKTRVVKLSAEVRELGAAPSRAHEH